MRIYEMVISLGSLLKMNTLSRNHNFTSISREMEYGFTCIFHMNAFEDKISCDIQIPEQVLSVKFPAFHPAPCGKNAIVSLGPKEGKGHLIIRS